MAEVIVVWVLVVTAMTVLSAFTIYHFYRLFPLRRRDAQLVVGVVAMILLDFLIVEPLHLLCGAYAPSVDIAHVLYLTLSAISYHGLMHSILLRVWILYFDTKWLWICCLSSNECTEWRHHILDPLSLSPSHSPSPSDTVTMHKASTSMTIGNGTESLKTSKTHKDTESKPTATEREEKELAEEEIHSLHPHDQHLNESTNCAPAHISWFIRHRSSYGTVLYAVRFCVVSALILIAAHLSALCLLRGTDRAVTLYLIDGVPVLLIYSLWIAMPEIKDYGTMSGRVFWRCLLILVAVTGSLQMAIKVMVTASKGMQSDDAMNSALSILSVAIRFCTDFAATLCLLWCPRYIRCREALRLEAQPVIAVDADGVRVNSMSFQIEMTGSNGNGNDNDNGGGTHSVDVSAGCTPNGDDDGGGVDDEMQSQKTQQAVLALFASSSSMSLLLRQCARECSVQNVFAIMELLQFRDYCMKQQHFIEEERMRRKKTAKLRYQRKRHSIHKRKRRRTQRLSMVNAEKESHDLSEDELIQHQIAQKEPIETAVTSSPDIEDDHEASDGGDDEEEEAVYGDRDGAERERIDIAEWLHIPKSSLIHRPTGYQLRIWCIFTLSMLQLFGVYIFLHSEFAHILQLIFQTFPTI